jgi:hypothetical protein
MLGLPVGTTPKETPVGLDADLKTLKLNCELRPTMAWASIFTPYRGTKAHDYCKEFGYYDGSNDDLPGSFFDRSVLRFPKRWVGHMIDSVTWMSLNDQYIYREQLRFLRSLFHVLALVPRGWKIAREVLAAPERLGQIVKTHLYESELYGVR